jgi:acyl-CoA dehydrogenase
MATSSQPVSENQDFDALLKRVHQIGKDVVQPAAEDVDKNARFPREAIDALKEAKLLSAYVPVELGGMGLNITQIAKICEALGQYCGSSAMVYAMHKIQVACVVHHGMSSSYFRNYMQDLVKQQRLMASATTEIGVGGDLRSSVCAVAVTDKTFTLTKKAPVISYGVDDLSSFRGFSCQRSGSCAGEKRRIQSRTDIGLGYLGFSWHLQFRFCTEFQRFG